MVGCGRMDKRRILLFVVIIQCQCYSHAERRKMNTAVVSGRMNVGKLMFASGSWYTAIMN